MFLCFIKLHLLDLDATFGTKHGLKSSILTLRDDRLLSKIKSITSLTYLNHCFLSAPRLSNFSILSVHSLVLKLFHYPQYTRTARFNLWVHLLQFQRTKNTRNQISDTKLLSQHTKRLMKPMILSSCALIWSLVHILIVAR